MKTRISVQERLKDLRVERGLNLEELAQETGISKSALGSYENDNDEYKEINHGSLLKLADFYQVSVDYLLGLTNNRRYENTPIEELHLSDEVVELLKSERFNNRLLCEIISHEKFKELLADAEIYVDGIATMHFWTACRKIDSEIKHPPVVELRKSKLQQEGRFMSRPYAHVQGLLPSVLAMKEEGYTYRQIAKQFGLTKEQVEELCGRARRKQRRIEKGYIPQPKGRPRKTPATQEQLQNNRIVELEMKVELLQNFLSECGRM